MVKLIKFSLIPVVVLLLGVLWVQGGLAHDSVDQFNEEQEGERLGTQTITFAMPIGQEFTPARSTLTGVDLYLASVNSHLGDGEDITVNMRKGAWPVTSGVLTSSSQVVSIHDRKGNQIDGWVHFDFQPTINVVMGDVYVLEVVAPPFGEPAAGTHAMNWTSGNQYPGGRAIFSGIPNDEKDFLFRTYYSQTSEQTSEQTSGHTSELTPWELKEGALEDLEVLSALVGGKVGEDIDKAVQNLANSLDTALWVDDNYLVADVGEKVFTEDQHALKTLMQAIKAALKEGDDLAAAELERIMNDILSADEALAQTAIYEADPEAIDAGEALADARAARDDGKFDKAARLFGDAWEVATGADQEEED